MTWREYQRRPASTAALRRWARRGLFGNVGIVCGTVSGNLAVLDFDAPGTYDAFRVRFPNLKNTFTVATGGGGWHVYLRVDVLPPSRRGQGVELCAEGRQVAAPPSIHPKTGSRYRVEVPVGIRHIPELSDVVVWLESVKRQALITPVPGWTNATPSTLLITTIAETLQARGYRLKGDWLSGPCVYPQRHAHNDSKTSFGFNTCTGYGNCFRCGSMLAKDIARAIGIDPVSNGGVFAFLKENSL